MSNNFSKEALDRLEKIKLLKEASVVPYANKFEDKQDIKDIKGKPEKVKDVEPMMNEGSLGEFKTAWRLMSFKSHGRLSFGKIRDNTDTIQVCFVKDRVEFNTWREVVTSLEVWWNEITAYKMIDKMCYVGDYIGLTGDLFLTKHGELTLFVKEFQMLSKAIRPLPEKWHGIKDQEMIYRQRYLDMIMNEDSYERLRGRSHFMKAIRDFYFENGFIEIETPVLWNAASGAAAQPFITHHNDFDSDFFLRISPETALKKATVGRFEKVFEVSRNFRNEWSDPSHMQEFTAIEHYAAYWNFEDNMKFTEAMFDYIFNHTDLKREVNITDKEGNTKFVNFKTPWERIDYIEWVKKASGINIKEYTNEDADKLRLDIKAKWIEFEGMDIMWTPTLIDYLFKKVLRPSIIWPAFIYNYPRTMQPLARQNDKNPEIVEQFQVVVNWWEILKAYSELVDPEIQKANFDEQSGALERWDEEATSWDDDFVLAMEYGMPCQSWWGMGIERIYSLLTEQENLRDVVLFPLMKENNNHILPEEQEESGDE